MPLTVKKNIPNSKKLFRDIKNKFQKNLKRTIVDIIIEYIVSGRSPVKGYGTYKKYSESYAKVKGRERPVDLLQSGRMLENMVAVKKDGGVTIKFRDKRNADLTSYHNFGQGNLPKRRILPSQNEAFKKGITDKISKLLNKAVKDSLR